MVNPNCMSCRIILNDIDIIYINMLNDMSIGYGHQNFCRECNISWISRVINEWHLYSEYNNNINNYINALNILRI